MEATKKTTTTRAALLVVAALSMLLSGLMLATGPSSDASPPPACPDGFNLTADEKNCFQAAVVTSADNPNSCDKGQLTPDGSKCYTIARVIPQEGKTLCPKGFSPDDSLGGMCARFEAADQKDPGCPDGARGTAGGCYILVAKGPRGAATCAEGTLAGSNCVITGNPPVNGPSSCPVSATVIETGNQCYTLVSRQPAGQAVCAAPYIAFGTQCKSNNTGVDQASIIAFTCPAAPQAVTQNMHETGGITKIESCEYTPVAATACPANTIEDRPGDPTSDCRRSVDLRPGAKVCDTGFGIVDGKCIRYISPNSAVPQCPAGSVEDNDGDCRKPVADQKGDYFCKDANAALNGKSCVYTAGFLIEPSPTLYKCDEGTRTVIGAGSSTQVICILGDANPNTTSGPSCLQGVLSTDSAYCIVPRIDTAPAAAVAAPVPSFTG